MPDANSNLAPPARPPWLAPALLVLITILVYLPAMNGGFIWDDDRLVTDNTAVKSIDGLYSIWFGTWSDDYVPLTRSVFWVEWHLFDSHAAGYHIINILIHAANAILLWRVLRSLRVPGCWLAALLFAVHPVCAASVVWIAELKNTLSMFFYLLSALLFLGVDESPHPRRVLRLSIGAFALSVLSKGSVAVLPLVLFLCVWWKRGRIERRDTERILPFFVLAVLMALVSIAVQHQNVHGSVASARDGLMVRLLGGGWALWFYLGKILLPINLTMIYPRWKIDPGAVVSWLPGILFAAALVVFWRYRKTWGRPFFFAFAYFAIVLAPVLGPVDLVFFSNSRVADHFQYLAIPGIIALVCAIIRQKARSGFCIGLCLTLVLGALTFQRARVLADGEKLWTDNIRKNPQSWQPYMALNLIYLNQGKTNEAIQMYRRAVALYPPAK